MATDLDGQVVVVSGGADGVGAAASQLFAEAHARVAILDVRAARAEETVGRIHAAGGEALFVPCDVSQAEQVATARDAVHQRLGPVDILVNHAGTLIVKPFLETTEMEWDHLMAVNVKSMFLTSQSFLPDMLARRHGAIVNTSSISGFTAAPMESAYCTTKGAVSQLTRSIAVEFRDQGIRCNAVLPGFIRTAHGEREVDELQALGVDVSPAAITQLQGRMAEPEEVARVIRFLASEEASFINGALVVVDNAATAQT
jgi:NAD(P)-dependent dehydrogenase (short-subunit alcohol dehydrogenase family)